MGIRFNKESRMGKKATIKHNGETYYLTLAEYAYCGRTAVQMWCSWGEPYADVSVNIMGEIIEGNEIAVDTNNLPEWVLPCLRENGIVGETKRTASSGFCVYPVVDVNKDKFV